MYINYNKLNFELKRLMEELAADEKVSLYDNQNAVECLKIARKLSRLCSKDRKNFKVINTKKGEISEEV